jgi:hypothetical protein
MRIYTVQRRLAPPGAEADVVLVPEGFCWSAALLPPVWLVWHRQWLGLAAWLAGGIVLGAAAAFADSLTEAAVSLGYAVLVGTSANDWRCWRLAAEGYRLEEVIAASSLEEAETRYFAALAPEPAAPPPPRILPSAPRYREAAAPLAPWSP